MCGWKQSNWFRKHYMWTVVYRHTIIVVIDKQFFVAVAPSSLVVPPAFRTPNNLVFTNTKFLNFLMHTDYWASKMINYSTVVREVKPAAKIPTRFFILDLRLRQAFRRIEHMTNDYCKILPVHCSRMSSWMKHFLFSVLTWQCFILVSSSEHVISLITVVILWLSNDLRKVK